VSLVNPFASIKSVLTFCLLAGLAWLLGDLAWKWVSPQPSSQLELPSLEPLNQTQQSPVRAAPVYLFGRNEAKPVSKPVVEQKKVKKTRLNLKLMGVLSSPHMSVAIISKSGKSESYVLEDSIQRGVVLKEVHGTYVVLDNNGAYEKLQMDELKNVFSGDASQPSAAASRTSQLNAKQRAKLDKVKQKALENPVSIMRYVRFKPVNKNGKIKSVKLWPQKEKEIFKSLGFKSGDQLTEVNGRSIAEISASPDLWQELINSQQLELVVERKGQSIPLSVQLN